MSLTPEQVKRLNKLNANVAFRTFAATFSECERSGRLRQVSEGHVECDVVDRTMNPGKDGQIRYRIYATGRGRSEQEAFEDAILNAERSPKPITPAQMADIAAGRIIDPKAAKRIAELEADRDALRQEVAELKAAKKAKGS